MKDASGRADAGPDDRLLDAYLATGYGVFTPRGRLELRIGRRQRGIEAVLRRRGRRQAVLLTACNPRSVLSPPLHNRRAHGRLLAALRRRGVAFLPTVARADADDWPAEYGVLALGLGAASGLALARRFGQYGFVLARLGEPARLALIGPDAARPWMGRGISRGPGWSRAAAVRR